MSKLYKILTTEGIVESPTPGTYAGYKRGKIFGLLSCKSGMRMKPQNRVFFHTMREAIELGYRPCMNCKPMSENEFRTYKPLIPEKTLEQFYRRK